MKLAVPHSIFALGRRPAPGEPIWLDEDTEAVLAWFRYEATRCPGCGLRREDWDPALGGDPSRFTVTTETCVPCEEKAVKQEQVSKEDAVFQRGKHIVIVEGPSELDDDDEVAGPRVDPHDPLDVEGVFG